MLAQTPEEPNLGKGAKRRPFPRSHFRRSLPSPARRSLSQRSPFLFSGRPPLIHWLLHGEVLSSWLASKLTIGDATGNRSTKIRIRSCGLLSRHYYNGRQPANASRIQSPRPIRFVVHRTRKVPWSPPAILSFQFAAPPTVTSTLHSKLVSASPPKQSSSALHSPLCPFLSPFRLALLRASTMRPAPLAPSAFPAPPKEFPFQIVRSAHCGPRLNSKDTPRNASASGFGSMRHSLFRAQATGTERTFHL